MSNQENQDSKTHSNNKSQAGQDLKYRQLFSFPVSPWPSSAPLTRHYHISGISCCIARTQRRNRDTYRPRLAASLRRRARRSDCAVWGGVFDSPTTVHA